MVFSGAEHVDVSVFGFHTVNYTSVTDSCCAFDLENRTASNSSYCIRSLPVYYESN